MTEPDPDQLLKSLEASTMMMRAKHSSKGINRNTTRVMSIVIIIIVTIGVLGVMQYMASELSSRRPPPKADAVQPINAESK
ncbi:MAG: hypothetical protein WCD79_13435 [Chthoniobacteraceae bacterium]